MICRKLVKDNITKKQNIVWFGSYGKNTNYIPVNFILGENNQPKDWDENYLSYYYYIQPGNGGPYQNNSPIWNLKQLYLSTSLLPKVGLYPASVEYGYYKKDEESGTFIPVLEIPEDWSENYTDYYIIKFVKNSSPIYDSTKTYYIHNNKLSAENYSKKQEGVRDSLIQRLSIIKGELWYKASYGLPLTEKIKNKGIYDSIIINIINDQPDVKNIIDYNSSVDKTTRSYTFNFTVLTVYNEEVKISYII